MEESWKKLKGVIEIGDNYEVSNLGRVRNIHTGRVLKQRVRENGYLDVNLNLNGRQKTCKVHRLVALAFIPNPENKREVNHIDKDRKNNKLLNLEWASGLENREHIKKDTESVTFWKSKYFEEFPMDETEFWKRMYMQEKKKALSTEGSLLK